MRATNDKKGRLIISYRIGNKTFILSTNVDKKNSQKQSFQLPFVARLATNGNRAHCFPRSSNVKSLFRVLPIQFVDAFVCFLLPLGLRGSHRCFENKQFQ